MTEIMSNLNGKLKWKGPSQKTGTVVESVERQTSHAHARWPPPGFDSDASIYFQVWHPRMTVARLWMLRAGHGFA